MPSLLQDIALAGERVEKYAVASLALDAASILSGASVEIDKLITEIPAAANDLLAMVEGADEKVLSAIESAQVNTVLASLEVDLIGLATTIATDIESATLKVVAWLQAYAEKLRAEAAATK
jgi:hypothetical protein